MGKVWNAIRFMAVQSIGCNACQLIDALAPTPLPLFHAAKLVGTSAGRRHDEQQTNLAGTAFPC